MAYKETRTKSGISVLTAEPIVDLEKEIDDRHTQLQESKYLGLVKRGTIYVPNRYAPEKRMSPLATAAAGGVLLLAGCAGVRTKSHISPPVGLQGDLRNYNENEGKDSEKYQKGVRQRKSQT